MTPTVVLPRGTPAAPHAKWWLRIVVVGIAVVTLGLAAAGVAWLMRHPASSSSTSASTPAQYASIAVLPFKNTSARPADSEHMSEGLSQAVINRLTQMSNLRVPPWMTARRFNDSTIPVEKLAAELRVDALLVGTFQEEGQRIRGTVSIVDGKSGFQIWADEFDEPLSDIFRSKIASRWRRQPG